MSNISIPCITCKGEGRVEVPDPRSYDPHQYRVEACGTCLGHGFLIATELLCVKTATPLGHETTPSGTIPCPCCGSWTKGLIPRPPETLPAPEKFSLEDLAEPGGTPT